MQHLAHRIKPITGYLPIFLLGAFLAPSLLLISVQKAVRNIQKASPVSAPIAAAIKIKKPVYNTLPLALDMPAVVRLVAPTKVIILPKIAVIAPKTAQKISVARLRIPAIRVNAVIRDMGLTSDGAMAVPDNRVDVGWYSHGTRPGETGSAVIGGHNEWTKASGVFVDLHQLKIGDVLSVTDAKGVSVSFVVREMRTFDAGDENSGIFASESGAHLNLITCSGVWDPATNSYTTRLVVFTDVVAARPA